MRSTLAAKPDPPRCLLPLLPGLPFPNRKNPTFRPSEQNSDGDPDWVLILESGGPKSTQCTEAAVRLRVAVADDR